MSFHVIKDKDTEYVGPAEYERAHQGRTLTYFRDWSDALALYPKSTGSAVEYMMARLPKPRSQDAPYARDVMERYLTLEHRQFRSAYAAHARHKEGPKPPPEQIKDPTLLPESVIPGQRKEMVDPDTGEVKTVFVQPETSQQDQTSQIDPIAVAINGALAHLYTSITSKSRQADSLEQGSSSEVMEEEMRRSKQMREQARTLRREVRSERGYFDVLGLVRDARPKHPDATTTEDIVRAEGIDLTAHGLNYKKLREFVAAFQPKVQV
ncbi:hypothetical protein OG195_44390 (plasmid) [Streptomyces sp. NBC_01362]|uniref:hypothetical protein n=1 Tax=Streptomyces sp. NBC_01362 TaxID=2903839 RepID=UPI002E2EAC4E|nr:hypothetical protein [Streptomyces sp. NBC_01362]